MSVYFAEDGGRKRANRRADGFDGYEGCPHRHCPTADNCSARGDCRTLVIRAADPSPTP